MNNNVQEKIQAMRKGGKILAEVLAEVVQAVKPGVTELELDKLAEKRIIEKGGFPAFKKVPGYKHTICAATNDVVVHGIPQKRVLQAGDVICIDCGVFVDGYFTDMAETVVVGDAQKDVGEDVRTFLKVGKKALFKSIREATSEHRIGHISRAMQETVEKNNYSIVKSLVGHGVGKNLHEAPEVPGFLSGKLERTPRLVLGMTLALEVIYNMGSDEVVYANKDGWTISTADGSLSAVFERTILIAEDGPELITAFEDETIHSF